MSFIIKKIKVMNFQWWPHRNLKNFDYVIGFCVSICIAYAKLDLSMIFHFVYEKKSSMLQILVFFSLLNTCY